jgi:hypothetical protein
MRSPTSWGGKVNVHKFGTLVAVGLAMFSSSVFAATQVCAPWKKLTQQLQIKHGEVLVARGIDASGILYSVLANPTGGWSIVATRASDRITCIMAIGRQDAIWYVIEPNSIKQQQKPKL